MDSRHLISPFRVPQIPADKSSEKLTAGVPLVKLIKRRLVDSPEIVMNRPRSAATESFLRLKASLVNRTPAAPQVIVVTSAGPGEGKSFVSINLALAFAADSRGKVLLIDADLRRPSIGKWLTPAPTLGLSEIVRSRTEVGHAVLTLEDSALGILPAGEPPSEPGELLASEQTKALISSLRGEFRTIIIDTSPILPFADADVIGAWSDGVVLVARSGSTERSAFERAQVLVTSTFILGTVLNVGRPCLADWGRYSNAGYTRYYGKERRK